MELSPKSLPPLSLHQRAQTTTQTNTGFTTVLLQKQIFGSGNRVNSLHHKMQVVTENGPKLPVISRKRALNRSKLMDKKQALVITAVERRQYKLRPIKFDMLQTSTFQWGIEVQHKDMMSTQELIKVHQSKFISILFTCNS